MDSRLAQWLNDQAVHHPVIGRLAIWCASHLAVVLLATLALGWTLAAARDLYTHRRVSWRLAELPLRVGLALGAGLFANQLIGHIWFRPRPYDAIANIQRLLPASADPSFPSDHATFAAALTLAVLPTLPWLGRLLLVETVLLVVGRVAVGLHYPGDVLGGLCIALAAVMLADELVVRLRGRLLRLAVRRPVRALPVTLPIAPAAASGWLRLSGLGAVLLGLPAVVEALADPVRLHPAWVEHLFLIVAASGLGLLWFALVHRWPSRGRRQPV